MSVLKQLVESRDTAARELKELVGEPGEQRELSEEQEQRSVELSKELDEFDARIKEETRKAKRQQRIAEARELVRGGDEKVAVSVESEPMVYGEGSPHSYFADLIVSTSGRLFGMTDPGADQRLAQWSHQVEREIANGSKQGTRAEHQLREIARTENGVEARQVLSEARERGRASLEAKAEQRGIATGGGATGSASGGGGAAFVTPVFYVSDYAPYREAGRAFADQCSRQPLPDYGMNIYMPQVTGKAGIATQTEGSGVNETDPSAGYLSAGLITKAGQVTVTQQLLDRAGPNFSFDKLIFDQLNRDLAPNVDSYVLTQALANAGTVAFQGTWAFVAQPGTASFVSKLAGASNAIETTNGTIMSPTHVFVAPSRWNYIESVGALESSSGTLHPLVVPSANGPFNAVASQQGDGYVNYEGDTGYKILGLPVFKDLNIPAPTSGADQAVVGNLREVYVYEGQPVPRVIPQTYANNLQVLLQLYEYLAVIVRYPSAIQTVTGAAMSSISF